MALAARWDAGFTAAYFDHAGLYAFGRQGEAIRWNCGQLAVALRPMAETAPLVAALERFEPIFQRRLPSACCGVWACRRSGRRRMPPR
jgi:uncharacterized protein YdiU (UPF0061 family)